jgi:hypothetical protein
MGTLRHEVVAHEAGCLHRRKAGSGESVRELGAHRRAEHVWLVLEAVAWPDVAERESHARIVPSQAATVAAP